MPLWVFCVEFLCHEDNDSTMVVLGWLEPLLDRIARNRQSAVCPSIDAIKDDSFEYVLAMRQGVPPVGGFDWNLKV